MEIKSTIPQTVSENQDKSSLTDTKNIGTDFSYRHEIVLKNAIGFLIIHVLALWGLAISLTGGIMFKTFLWTVFVKILASQGITMGAHRLFTHKTFKAKPGLRAALLIMQVMAGQNSMLVWCRDHRLHHRYTDTDADPHNSKRGFFFSHIGWLMSKKHPYVIELGKKIDISDLKADWMVMFQKKYYYYLFFMFAFLIPVWVPVHFFGESWLNSILFTFFFRYVYQLNGTWLVNSAAHLWGTRPYDRNIQPVESWFVSFITYGEGWHNYHHAFPWDYKCAEFSEFLNYTARLIKLFETLGWAYDLKTAPPEMMNNRIWRSGDGTHYKFGNDEAKAAVTAFGFLHPLNPSYNVTYKLASIKSKDEGLPTLHEKDILNNYELPNFESRFIG